MRDLVRDALPHTVETLVNGRLLPPEKRTPAQARALGASDELIEELAAADVVVLAVPVSVPASLKAWIDHVVRSGRTFAYSEAGPERPLKGKKAVVVVSRGGVYPEGSMQQLDFQEFYLHSTLAFIGISDVHTVRVEGMAMGDEAIAKAIASAKAGADEVVQEIESAASLELASEAA